MPLVPFYKGETEAQKGYRDIAEGHRASTCERVDLNTCFGYGSSYLPMPPANKPLSYIAVDASG